MNRSRIQIDMFPFLSVLCAVIGVLMLFLIMTISTRIVQSDAVNVPDRPGPERSDGGGQLGPAELEAFREQLTALTELLHERQTEFQDLLEQRARLEELLALREAEQVAAGNALLQGVELSPEQQIVMVPEGDVAQRPVFIELGLEAFIVHPEHRGFPAGQLPDNDQPLPVGHVVNTPFERFLEQAHDRRNEEYLVFLVRPEGCDNFHRVRDYLRTKYPHPENSELSRVPMGWEPFSADWSMAVSPGPTPEPLQQDR